MAKETKAISSCFPGAAVPWGSSPNRIELLQKILENSQLMRYQGDTHNLQIRDQTRLLKIGHFTPHL